MLYEVITIAWAKMKNKTGFTSGVFLCGYSFCRMFVEQFREPDVQVGFVFSHITMGQILSTVITSYSIHYTKLYDLRN